MEPPYINYRDFTPTRVHLAPTNQHFMEMKLLYDYSKDDPYRMMAKLFIEEDDSMIENDSQILDESIEEDDTQILDELIIEGPEISIKNDWYNQRPPIGEFNLDTNNSDNVQFMNLLKLMLKYTKPIKFSNIFMYQGRKANLEPDIINDIPDNTPVDESDVKLVMAQTRANRKRAIKALQKHHGDLLDAIYEITEHG